MPDIYETLSYLTVPSSDDGLSFTQPDRLARIQSALDKSDYSLFGDLPLAYLFRSQTYSPEKPAILVSAHIDSIYEAYFTRRDGEEVIGTFDNSACNAVVLHLMLTHRLPSQVLVAFTGDEEGDSRGADQTIAILQNNEPAFRNLELVITLDLTEEAFGRADFTVENYFIEEQNEDSLLRFTRKRELKDYLMDILEHPLFVKNADQDESWQYDEHDLNCFSLCLPCKVLGEDIHDDFGVKIRAQSFFRYAEALESVTHRICNDLANKAVDSTRYRA